MAPDDAGVQAAMASHFVREQLPSVLGDEDLAGLVAAGFQVAQQGGCLPLAEFAVFLWKVAQDQEGALKTFQQAIAENPEDGDLRYNYGNFLDQAMGQQEQAAVQYELALVADPLNNYALLNNYAALLVEQARGGADVLGKAQELLVRAEGLAPGFPAYNLACISCLQNNATECEHWLRVAYSSESFEGLPGAADLMQDDDLQGVSEADWFKQLLAEVSSAQENGSPLTAPSQNTSMQDS